MLPINLSIGKESACVKDGDGSLICTVKAWKPKKMNADKIDLTPLFNETVYIARPRGGSASTVALAGSFQF